MTYKPFTRKRPILDRCYGRLCGGVMFILLASLWAVPSRSAETQGRGASEEDFFIVSSVDASKQQLLLKHPTEVTELMFVNDKTVLLDEQGKPLPLTDLRAGDTVYVTSSRTSAGGTRLARRIRKGGMTPEQLHRRYLRP